MKAASQEYVSITTDDTLRETLSHGSERYPFAYYLDDIGQFDFHRIDWHWHPEVELLSVAEGTAICLVGEDKIDLPKGFGLFVNSGVLHRFEAVERTIIPNIVFSPSLFASEESLVYEKYVRPIIHSAAAYQVLNPKIVWQNDILQILSAVYGLQEGKDKEFRILQQLLKMWDIFFQNLDKAATVSDIRHTNSRQAKLQIMMQYIQEHYKEPVTLEQIASAVFISKSSALSIFQAGIHISPIAYLIQYRLRKAGELLRTTEKTVSSIAEEAGFMSVGYFCRKFKEQYGTSPNAYRKKKAEQGN